MSNITTGFDAIKARLEALFTSGAGYYQLSNPYDVDENTTSALQKGWGIAIGSASNTNRQLSCNLSLQRTMTIVLTRRRYANELDTVPKETAEKQLLEDQYILIKDLEKAIALNSAVSGLTRFQYTSDGGIESVIEGDAFIKLVTDFEMEYFEDLNT